MNESPSQIRRAEIYQWRQQVISELRQFADLLEATNWWQLPTPDIYLSTYSVDTPTDDEIYATAQITPDHVRRAMAVTPGNWRKRQGDSQITYTKAIGDSLRYHFHVSRSTTCRQVQTGTRTVEAVPEHTVPVYEWVCDDTTEVEPSE